MEKIINYALAFLFVGVPTFWILMSALGTRSTSSAILWCSPFLAALLAMNYRYHLHLILIGIVLPFGVPGLSPGRGHSILGNCAFCGIYWTHCACLSAS